MPFAESGGRKNRVSELHKADTQRIVPASYVTGAEEVRSNIKLRLIFSIALLSIFGISVLLTYALIFLWGYGAIHLDKAFTHWLGAGTIGQTASMLFIMVRYLFPSRRAITRRKEGKSNQLPKTAQRSP
jgi:hypothetical protein